MNSPLYIQPGEERPSGIPAGRINVAHGAKPSHVDEAIDAGVNFISVRGFRWADKTKQRRIWASLLDIENIENRLREKGWTQWNQDENCWLPPES